MIALLTISQAPAVLSSGDFLSLFPLVYLVTLGRSLFQECVQPPLETINQIHNIPWQAVPQLCDLVCEEQLPFVKAPPPRSCLNVIFKIIIIFARSPSRRNCLNDLIVNKHIKMWILQTQT